MKISIGCKAIEEGLLIKKIIEKAHPEVEVCGVNDNISGLYKDIIQNLSDIVLMCTFLSDETPYEIFYDLNDRKFIIIIMSDNPSDLKRKRKPSYSRFFTKSPFDITDFNEILVLSKEKLKKMKSDTINLSISGKPTEIKTDDIIFIKADRNYSLITFTNRPKPEIVIKNLKNLLSELDNRFLRVHHSYAINLNNAKEIIRQGRNIKMINNELVPVAKRRKHLLDKLTIKQGNK